MSERWRSEYGKWASLMFNIFNISRDVCEFMIKRCEWMMVWWRTDSLRNDTWWTSSTKGVSVWNLAYADVWNPYLVMNQSKYYGWSSICEVKPLNSHARSHNSTQLALDGRLYQDKYLSDSRNTGPRVRVKNEYKLNSISRLVFWVEHQAHASDERRPSRPPSALRRGVCADFRGCLWLDFAIIIWG